MLQAVTMHYDGRNRAWGGFSPQGAQPTAGSLSIVVGDKPRTWVAQYGAGGTMSEKHNPDWKPPPQHVIPDDQRSGSLDPLSAALTVGLAGDAACDRTVPTNDGKRRIDIMIHKIGIESAATAGVPTRERRPAGLRDSTPSASSGEFDDAPKEAETERERPMKVWLARFDKSQVRYPGQARGQHRLRHDPRQGPVVPRASDDAAGKPGDAALAAALSRALLAALAQDAEDFGGGGRECWCRGRRSRRRRSSSGSRSPAPG